MIHKVDIAIIGAGPAGMSLAQSLVSGDEKTRPPSVAVIDEQKDGGGQVYRAALRQAPDLASVLGQEYQSARPWLQEASQNPDIQFYFRTSAWNIEPREDGVELALVSAGRNWRLRAKRLVLASGAMERPTPFSGWQTPGVMTMGAAQTLMKDAGLVPDQPLVLLGSGPLLYLFAKQLLQSGVSIQAVLHTGPRGLRAAAWAAFWAALPGNFSPLGKGLLWRMQLALARVPQVFNVAEVVAQPDPQDTAGGLGALRYRVGGHWHTLQTGLVLVHDGVVPNTHLAAACGCSLTWDQQQACWRPELDETGRSSQSQIWALGDGARIMGSEAARWQGVAMAPALLESLGYQPSAANLARCQEAQRRLAPLQRLRRFLDAQFPPAGAFSEISDDTQVCRCEAISAGEIRRIAGLGCSGVNQARSFTRVGMGPCMGRQCGASVAKVLAGAQGKPQSALGYFTVRLPLKPVTVGDLCALEADAPASG